jgi:hypothetical protein
MKNQLIDRLQILSVQFEDAAISEKQILLKELSKLNLPLNRSLIRLHDLLLFILAHPSNIHDIELAERLFKKLAVFLKKSRSKIPEDLTNSGLPFAPIVTQFSHDFIEWVSRHPHCDYVFDFSYHGEIAPGKLVKNALPVLERLDIDESANWDEVFEQLGVPQKKRQEFVVDVFSSLNERPHLKDSLFDSLYLYTTLYPKSALFSRSYNRISVPKVFYHTDILKKYDFVGILNTPLPEERNLKEENRSQVVNCLKNTMALTARETDPATFMGANSLKLFDLERGISVAIFGMKTLRQLPFETYFGFTLFKNGLPAAYGGAWVFGKRARFGINIFEPYRGGESGMVMSQILRVYRQNFGIDFIEIEAYQFGQDNPDGIKSGAYWFYYKHGFRSIDKELKNLAESEKKKMANKPDYRSSEKTLIRFTESNMALMLTPETPPDVTELNSIIRKHLNKNFGGLRTMALKKAMDDLRILSNNTFDSPELKHVANEWALLLQAKEPYSTASKKPIVERAVELIEWRVKNLYRYQKELSTLIPELFRK